MGIVTKGNSSWWMQVWDKSVVAFGEVTDSANENLIGSRNVNDGQWHHVAGVYDGTNMFLYVDGTLDVSYPVTGLIAQNSDPVCIGANAKAYVPSCGCNKPGYFFNGLIDEVSIYNCALSASEIQLIYAAGSGGKCPPSPTPPAITTQPVSQTNIVGTTACFSVTASGTPPLSYQWNFNGTNIAGATNTSLTLTNVQLNQAGNYAVLVTNAYGTALSSNAVLTVLNSGGIVAYFTDNNPTDVGPQAPIKAAGFLPLHISDISTQILAGFGILFIDENSNSGLSSPLLARLADIQSWVNGGGRLIVHDRSAGNISPNPFLLGAPGTVTVRSLTSDIDVIPPGTNLVVAGPFGAINNTTLDGGYYSAHGYVMQSQLPAGACPVLSMGGASTNVVAFSYPLGLGEIYYSSIPLDCYLAGNNCSGSTIAAALQNIYTPNVLIYAGNFAPCSNCPPAVFAQPLSQSVAVGSSVTFSLAAMGTAPLSYFWQRNGTTIAGANNSSYTTNNVQLTDSGSQFSCLVSNTYGSVLSSNAALTVNQPPPCDPAPSGLISWWPGEGNANDVVGGNNGVVISGTVSYAAAEVGQGFSFDGGSNRLVVPDSPVLDFGSNQDFSIEAWISPLPPPPNLSSGIMTIVDKRYAPNSSQCQGYEFNLVNGTVLHCHLADAAHFSSNGTDWAATVPDLRDGNMHHVALTLVRNSTTGGHIYVDGVQVLEFNPTAQAGDLSTPQPLRIGNHPDATYYSFFKGRIDELAIYRRALSSNEVAAIYNAGVTGKCPPSPTPPSITLQPTNQTVAVGVTVTFSVTASGTPPLSYQWNFNGTNIVGATNTMLTLTNVQLNQAGNYAVLVTNAYGSALSSNAVLVIGIHHFVWNQIPSPQLTNQPFPVTILAKDANNGTITNFAGTVLLYGLATNLVGTNMDFEAGSLAPWQPLNAGPSPGPYQLVTFDVNGDGVASTAFRIAANLGAADGITQNIPLSAGVTCAVSMDIASDDEGGNNADGSTIAILIGGTTVAQHSFGSINSGQVLRTNLHGIYIPPSNGVYAVTLTFYRAYLEPGGLWSLADDLRIACPGPSVTTVPTVSGNFTNGIWNGNITVMNRAAGLVLVADDGNGHLGLSNPFDVLPGFAPPVITSQPTNQTVIAGGTAIFNVTATGAPPLSCQWRLGGTNIVGATNATLTLTNVQFNQSGNYSVLVTNAYGSILSSNAVLTVTLDHFAWSNIPSPRFVNTPFAVTLRAQNMTNGLFTNFTGTAVLGTTNSVAVTPPISGSFVQGVWTGSVVISQTVSNLVLQANDNLGHFGLANPINVISRPSLGMWCSGDIALFMWPVEYSGFVLEASGSLSPAAWVTVPYSPIQIGDQCLLPLDMAGTNGYYRLRFSSP